MTCLAYDLAGPADAPVLVLGPSLGTTRAMWDPQHALLCRRFRVLRYDLLGHGGSAAPDGPYTVDQLAGEVLSLLTGIEHFHYAGVSLGGMIGMELASAAPDRVDSLALLCTSAYLPPAEGWLDRARHVREHGTASIADAYATRWFTPAFADSARYLAMLAATPDEGYAACCHAIADMDLRPVLDGITAPTLVIAGLDDPATPPEHGRRIAEAIPGARFVAVAGAAHLANVERPAEVTGLLAEHLEAARDR